MQLTCEPKAYLSSEAREFINLYTSLGEQAENFLPNHIMDHLRNFVRLCYEAPDDPKKQQIEIDKYILELKELIPGYRDVSLMIYPQEDSKAFIYSSKKSAFTQRLMSFIDRELVDETNRKQVMDILNLHDFSIGTPPVTQQDIDFRYSVLLGDDIKELRKFRDVIGIQGDIEKAQWSYLLDVLDQMVNQGTHYTNRQERQDFLERILSTVNFKGLNGFIPTVVSGGADTAVKLIANEVFTQEDVQVIDFKDVENLYEKIQQNNTSIFIIKIKHMRHNLFKEARWFPLLTRMVFVDDSLESCNTNTSLVFCFHNRIIDALNKVHNKKLGPLANSQLNIRLLIDRIGTKHLEQFRQQIEKQILHYNEELDSLKKEQLGETDNLDKNIVLFTFDDFSKQILKDKYALSKLHDYIAFIHDFKNSEALKKRNKKLVKEFEERTRQYFYSDNPQLHITTIVEGGGRNQIKTYGDYLLQRKLKPINPNIIKRCKTIIDIIPNNYQRTLHNHFHKNFGINLFLEKYKEYISKIENKSDNQGRFRNFLIDLGIYQDYMSRTPEEQDIIKMFISDLANLEKTSISDDVQMIVRDLLFHRDSHPIRPYILFNLESSWEYKDLFPVDRFDINPFDLEIGLTSEGRIDYERLHRRLIRMKSTFQLFDDSGHLWDRFCENLTIVINDPSNPTGFSDFNRQSLIEFLRFLNHSKITLFLDEAYSDSIKIQDPKEPKWRTISRYIMNNIKNYSNISVVTSLSTTKNLGATGDRLGTLAATPETKEVIDFARKNNDTERGNTNSLYILVNLLELAQLAKKIKDKIEARLPKNASKYKIKQWMEKLIKEQIKKNSPNGRNVNKRASLFEGSPIHMFLLSELAALEKLDVLGLPDDFKYKGVPFFSYYRNHLVRELNTFRVNKNFRSQCLKRLSLANEIANGILSSDNHQYVTVMPSDGSYLFNIRLKDFFSYQDLEKYTKKLAEARGIAVLPYKTGGIRFSLGGYIEGGKESYITFKREFRQALSLFLYYWEQFYNLKTLPENNEKRSEDLLDEMFNIPSDQKYLQALLLDFKDIIDLKKKVSKSLKINNRISIYHSFPADCGLTISTIDNSQNSVFEFYENVGTFRDVVEFVNSKAFSKMYENLLPQVYQNIPFLRHLDVNTLLAKYGKSTILKYIKNKISYQPNYYVLDNPDEKFVMTEILIEVEKILFSDSKFKIMALDATHDIHTDQAKLEGINRILKKYFKELLLYFNLPFENLPANPALKDLLYVAIEQFEEIIGKEVSLLNLKKYCQDWMGFPGFSDWEIPGDYDCRKFTGFITDLISQKVIDAPITSSEKILKLFLLKRDDVFNQLLLKRMTLFITEIANLSEPEEVYIVEQFIYRILPEVFPDILSEIYQGENYCVPEKDLSSEVRRISLFLIDLLNKTMETEYYSVYSHTLMKLVEVRFKRQNSGVNEMIQHGITLHKDFQLKNTILQNHQNGVLSWINRFMTECGVIASEQPVQMHTRIVTDAKKREYPFHKVDGILNRELETSVHEGSRSSKEYIKYLYTRPTSDFFNRRMARFTENMDTNDYRCKIVKQGLIKILFIFHKAYIKYLTDCYRLFPTEEVSLEDAAHFVPDAVIFYGAPEKVISFPPIGYFDLPGPNGNIKTLVTPLKKEVDYFGDIKKPWLTMLNEKVKELGGIPKHGSLFALEMEDGAIFGVEVDGDSGAGKSEMLTAMMLKWIKRDLPGIRSIKYIAGDMFHVFPDAQGNLYGIGTEVGDFSRITDFDPEFVKNYKYLFETSADSNVMDKNARSTIRGLCDISMPYKIDILLAASNYAVEEAGIIRFDNPENFILYRNSHGERKEKATSSDNPNFQRTLQRYTADKDIVEVIAQHGNYLDNVLNWERDAKTGKYYLCSSFKMIDKIDLEEVVNKILTGKQFRYTHLETRIPKSYEILRVKFDVIKNRFVAVVTELSVNNVTDPAMESEVPTELEFEIDREIFTKIFDSIASTPSGQPFVSEKGQADQMTYLINHLKGGIDGKGNGRYIQLGILSTDIGRKGKEITGPQKAAEDLITFIKEIRIKNPHINRNRQKVKALVNETYGFIFKDHKESSEIYRYNFYLFQLDLMRKAEFVRIDDPTQRVDLSNLKDFQQVNRQVPFSPLLVTPNIHIELCGFSETYQQLMSLPHQSELAEEFYCSSERLYAAKGYSRETTVNNMIVQLLLLHGYMDVEDLNRGRITEKVNREILAAAKFAVLRRLTPQKKENKEPSVKKRK